MSCHDYEGDMLVWTPLQVKCYRTIHWKLL